MSAPSVEHKVRNANATAAKGKRHGLCRVAWAVCVSVFFVSGYVLADPADPPQKGEPGCGAEEPLASDAGPKAAEPPSTAAESVEKRTEDEGSPDKIVGPRWVCEKQHITLDPVWRGQPLTFNFEIRNEGTANLEIVIRWK